MAQFWSIPQPQPQPDNCNESEICIKSRGAQEYFSDQRKSGDTMDDVPRDNLGRCQIVFGQLDPIEESEQIIPKEILPQIHELPLTMALPSQVQCEQLDETLPQEALGKNSNTIKKVGRMILDHLDQFQGGSNNLGVKAMQTSLYTSKKARRNPNKVRDDFNTHHLKLMINTDDKGVNSANLKSLRKIIIKHLRRNILEQSPQIPKPNKLLYLNSLKCSSLRCINKTLATRLQMNT